MAGSELQDLRLAAAATFEFILQEAVLPNASVGEFSEVTDDMRQAGKEVSLALKPHNGPAIYRAAKLRHDAQLIQLTFSEDVRVTITSDRVESLKQFVQNNTGLEDADIADVAEFLETELLDPLRDEQYYIDD